MIPTSATSSSPPIASVGSISNSPTIPGSANASSSNGAGGSVIVGVQGQGNSSAFLGIASLILEGRPLAEDEYGIHKSRNELKTSLSGNTTECGRQSPKPSTSRAAFGENLGGAVSDNVNTSAYSIDLANYLSRKPSNSPDSTTSPFLRDYYSSSSESAASSVESNHSRWSQKLSQLRQESPSAHHHMMAARHKLAVECSRGSEAEYVALAINTEHHNHHHGAHEERRGGDFEILRRMSINQMNFYNSPNSMGGGGGGVGGSSSSAGGGCNENFMCSLQSLASNSCLRVGSPLLANATSPPRYSKNRQISSSSSSNTPRFSTPPHQQLDYTIGSSTSTSSPGSGGISNNSWLTTTTTSQMANSNNNNNNGPKNKEYLLRKCTTTTQRMAIPTPAPQQVVNNKTINTSPTSPGQNLHSNIFNRNSFTPSVIINSKSTTTATMSSSASSSPGTTSRNQTTITNPQQGPHCDQFLRKMGLAKGDALESEEHHCDMSYVNITCTRWRAYCIKMENILVRGDPICIEVYLGPVGHKILLEQWIITQKEKQPPPTMTLPSLCSAIRSQLYFSQISAWCDLIKKSDKTIYETGRVIYHNTPSTATSAAGDLATTTATNNAITTAPTSTSTTSTQHHHHPTTTGHTTGATGTVSSSSGGAGVGGVSGNVNGSGGIGGIVGCGKRRPSSSSSSSPRLNIFYRIKQYDSTACFNSKPNVHNFPNVNISENCSVSVCLKSLPRITGGIPKVGTSTTALQANIPTTSGLTATSTPPVNTSAATTSLAANKNKTKAAALVTTPTTTDKALSVTVKATTSAAAAAASTLTKPATTNANKTILIMNCDNSLKEHQSVKQQQQQPRTLTASTRCHSSSTSSSTYAANGRKSLKSLSAEIIDHQDIEFECDDLNIDLSAGGDGNGLVAGNANGSVGDCDVSNSSFSTNNCVNLSHREKQLIKYRKRMLKRDKKQHLRKTNEHLSATASESKPTAANNQMHRDLDNKMEQGEENDEEEDEDDEVADDDDDDNNSDTAEHNSESKYSSINSLAKGQRQQLPNNHIISIPCTSTITTHHHQQHVKMISTGTQTISNTCTSCGSEKSMICLKCNPVKDISSNNNSNYATEAATKAKLCGQDADVVVDDDDDEIMEAESSSVSSLSSSDIIHTPRNKAELLLQAIQRTPKSNKKHKHNKSKDLTTNQMAAIKQQHQQQQKQHLRPNTATSPSNAHQSLRNAHQSSSLNGGPVINGVIANNSSSSSNSSNLMGCQVCKRQKTQHNFSLPPSAEEISSDDNNTCLYSSSTGNNTNQNKSSKNPDTAGGEEEADGEGDNETDGGRNRSTDSIDNVTIVIDGGEHNKCAKSCDNYNETEIMEEEYFESSTKLTPHIDRCSLNNHHNKKAYYAQILPPNSENSTRACSTPPLEEQTVHTTSANNETAAMMAQFKTPTPSDQHQSALMKSKLQQQPHKQTPKPNLLHIACNFNKNEGENTQNHLHNSDEDNSTPTSHNPLLLRRSLPKVNLTPIFCNPNSMMVVSSSPIPIGNGALSHGCTNGSLSAKSADINVTEASPTFNFESPSSPASMTTVQKSNSAPTLPNSPSLSPRFIKASAIYKRRSRHLSDRSDRSSLCSDEQFSDEDIDSGLYSPFATSPVKLRTRLAAVFGRKSLLGNLEECLLQRRLVPKIEVMGFKLLLGASGGFCPTQLTIPAAAYFYEFKGETLSTPYLCEIRLPRKGYTVPRCGTVQATLLNPMGTVVRMFVIPYDMRDMPTLHQTFIRQRILADTGMQQSSCASNDLKENGVGVENVDNITMPKQQDVMNQKLPEPQHQPVGQQQQRSPQSNNESHLGHFISAESMKSLRYSIHLRFQTSRSGRLMLHTDIRLLISRRTDCDTAAAHAKGVLEAPNELITNTVMPTNPKYSARQDQTSSKI